MRGVGRGLAALSIGCADPAVAQVVERHLPPSARSEVAPITEALPPAETDDRPLGVWLNGIVLLPADTPVASVPERGIRFEGFAPPRRVALVRALLPLLDRPLSRRLIGEIAATVTRSYRRAGRPFASVTTPEQELTGGMLALRVVEFRADRLAVSASSSATAGRIAARMRFRTGAAIDARALQQDLAWLDRYPFRRTSAVFGAGQRPGTTDLTLTAAPGRPWQVFGGVGSSDAPSSGNVRIFAGAIVGELIGPDSIVSAQATTSGFDDPAYVGVATRIVKPLGLRHEIVLLAGYVRAHTTAAPFASLTRTAQLSLDLRFALPPRLLGDGRVGVELGRQWLDARFGEESIYRSSATTLALVAGYDVVTPAFGGTLAIDATVHVSPSGIGRDNRADRLFFARPGGGSATYAYATFDVSMKRAVARTLDWQMRLLLQASAVPLPALDQIGLGGSAYVRGYTLDDGGYDSAAMIRNTLALHSVGAGRRWAPYGFTDWGTGRYLGRARRETFGSVGVGVERSLGQALGLRVEAAIPLLDGVQTRATKPRFFVILTATL